MSGTRIDHCTGRLCTFWLPASNKCAAAPGLVGSGQGIGSLGRHETFEAAQARSVLRGHRVLYEPLREIDFRCLALGDALEDPRQLVVRRADLNALELQEHQRYNAGGPLVAVNEWVAIGDPDGNPRGELLDRYVGNLANHGTCSIERGVEVVLVEEPVLPAVEFQLFRVYAERDLL